MALDGSRLEAADGTCELVRVAGQLQIVTDVGVAVGCVEPRQARYKKKNRAVNSAVIAALIAP